MFSIYDLCVYENTAQNKYKQGEQNTHEIIYTNVRVGTGLLQAFYAGPYVIIDDSEKLKLL